MQPRIEIIGKRLLVGRRLTMSVREDRTPELWRSFMPLRNQIANRVDPRYYSLQIHPRPWTWKSFDPAVSFEKWAAVEVSDPNPLAQPLEAHVLNGGQYAVFTHVGPASTFLRSLQHIHETWLPASGYRLDHREFFEILGEDYNPADVNAAEEIWIPIAGQAV